MPTTVEVGFELTVGDTPYFRVSNPIKGILNNTEYRLAGAIWIDISDSVSSVTVKRGKNRELDRYSAASASIMLHNEDRRFDPLNTASPYVGNIIPRRSVRVITDGYVQFTGVIEDWNFDYDVSGKSNAQIVAADAFSLLAQQSLTAGTATTQLTGARIDAVLSQPTVAWPLTQRELDDGSAEVGSDVWGSDDNVLSYLQKVESSEQGQLFMSRDGNVRFINGSITPTSGTWDNETNFVTNPGFETASTNTVDVNGTATPLPVGVSVANDNVLAFQSTVAKKDGVYGLYVDWASEFGVGSIDGDGFGLVSSTAPFDVVGFIETGIFGLSDPSGLVESPSGSGLYV
jgi:hypothetical protein